MTSASRDDRERAAPSRDAEVAAFLQWALPRLGLRMRGFRNMRGTVRKRLVRRMAELGVANLDEYRARLEATPAEWIELGRMCRIPISRFHRDRAVFEVIANEILPERAASAAGEGRDRVRIWSAGCASGEEPYTIAILWHLEMARKHPGVALELIATDVEETMIGRADRGRYAEGSLRELPMRLRQDAFEPDDNAGWRVRDEMRQGIRFCCEDIREVTPDGPFDVVFCRNSAFTYLDAPTQRAIATRLIERVRFGGALVVGTNESLPPEFNALACRAPCIYEPVAPAR